MLALLQAPPTEAFDEREARVMDIRPGLESSAPEGGAALRNGLFVFPASDGVHGAELWATDGTTDGTMMLKDINTGPDSGFPDGYGEFSEPVTFDVFTVGGLITRTLVFFTADDGATGTELWATDGTSEGTVLVADLRPGPGSGSPDSSSPRWLANLNGALMFVAHNGVGFDNQLWRYDGAGASLVHVFGELNSPPEQLKVAGGTLFFAATDHLLSGGPFPAHGEELWSVEYTTYLVTSTADAGAGSLRQAILDANAFTNPPGCIDRICIDMAGPGPHMLQLQTQLPAVTDPVTICDPLYDPSVEARFLADGNLLGLDASGLIILTKDTEVIGIGWTRLKTGIKLAQGGANIHLEGLRQQPLGGPCVGRPDLRLQHLGRCDVEDSLFKDNDLDGQWLVDVELGFSMLNNLISDNGGNGVVLAGSSSGGITGNTPVTDPVVQSNGQFIVTVSPTNDAGYYRLRQR